MLKSVVVVRPSYFHSDRFHNYIQGDRHYYHNSVRKMEEKKQSPNPKQPRKYCVFGLGNPGKQYVGTRHNVGFDCVDLICKTHFGNDAELSTSKCNCLYVEGQIAESRVILAKPQTFMNLSGRAVRLLSDFVKVLPHNIIIIHDDIYLPLGTLRVRNSGGSGGHNGIEDILKVLPAKCKFTRIRVGVDQPKTNMDKADYVLDKFTSRELPLVKLTKQRVQQCVETIIIKGIDIAMNNFNKSAEEFEKQESQKDNKRERPVEVEKNPKKKKKIDDSSIGLNKNTQASNYVYLPFLVFSANA